MARHVVRRRLDHPTRVAVDGITAAGKTTFAAELAATVTALGRPAVHLSTDDFHHLAAYRRRDPDRARGYYRDAFDLEAFRRLVLEPLGPGGDRRYRSRLHDLASDEVVDEPPVLAAPDLVVVVDGSFLQAPALHGCWDAVVWLEVSEDEAMRRAVVRDHALFGSPEATAAAYQKRYHAACRLYVAELHPADSADVVVNNQTVDTPWVAE